MKKRTHKAKITDPAGGKRIFCIVKGCNNHSGNCCGSFLFIKPNWDKKQHQTSDVLTELATDTTQWICVPCHYTLKTGDFLKNNLPTALSKNILQSTFKKIIQKLIEESD